MCLSLGVVYFNQCLGDAHSKRWSKSSFLTFFVVNLLTWLMLGIGVGPGHTLIYVIKELLRTLKHEAFMNE